MAWDAATGGHGGDQGRALGGRHEHAGNPVAVFRASPALSVTAVLGRLVLKPGREGEWRRAFVALLLSGTLLVCPGFFGASHVLAHDGASTRTAEPPTASEIFSGAHHPAGHAVGTRSPDDTPPVEAAGYFAVLLALAGAALLAAFFGIGRAGLAEPPRPVLYRGRVSGLGPFPKGPSPPLLQVFRL